GESKGPGGEGGENSPTPSDGSPAERLDAALRAGDARAFDEALGAARTAALTDARSALAAASALLRLGHALEAREVLSLLLSGKDSGKESAPDASARLPAAGALSSRLGAEAALLLAEAHLELGEPDAA